MLLLISRLFLSSLLLLTISCSLSPLSSTNTGKTVGAGNIGIDFGNVATNYYTRLMFGASPNMDAGVIVEFGNYSTTGFYGKYALTQGDFSWAIGLGLGSGANSEYTFIENIFSVNLGDAIEFYWNARAINQSLDETDYEAGDDIGGIRFDELDVNYIYNAIGMNVWFSKSFGLNLYAIKVYGQNVVNDEPPFGISFFATM